MQTHQAAFWGWDTHSNKRQEQCDWTVARRAECFFLLPIALIGFQRRLVEIGRLRTPSHSHHRRLYAFFRQAPSRADTVCRWHVMSQSVVVSQVKAEHASRWPTRSGPVYKRQSWPPPQQPASATDAPCGYACRGVCRAIDRLDWALTGIEWLVRRYLQSILHTTPQPISLAAPRVLRRRHVACLGRLHVEALYVVATGVRER
jgi:hypothetical protein